MTPTVICILNDLSAGEIHAALADTGLDARGARLLQMHALRDGTIPLRLPRVRQQLVDDLRARIRLPRLEVLERKTSPTDGFMKYLLRGAGERPFEAVRIPLLHRSEDPKYVVCVSSQVGCAMGCAFCATGRMGFVRNLAAWEMVDQVARIREEAPHPIGGVVFMGMGEPMLNLDAVLRAARILSAPTGLAIPGKAITVSTVGIVPGIRRFTAGGHPYRLVVSLTTADPVRRRALLPVEAIQPLEELCDALREYHAVTRRRVTLAWTMLSGVNVGPEDARQLARWVRDLPIKLDLIDVNDSTGQFHPPSSDELAAFRDALRAELGVPVARRYSGGRDIHAACGMLATEPGR